MLDAAVDSNVIVLHAPAGTGKTNLVADWTRLRTAQHPAVWVRLASSSETEQDVWRTICDVCEALLGQPTSGGNALATAIAARGTDFTLVIDDFHHASRAMQQQVMQFAQVLPVGRVVLLTRRLDSDMLALYRVQLRLSIIATQDLVCTEPEISELANATGITMRIDPAEICQTTGGILLLVRLLLEAESGSRKQPIDNAIVEFATSLLGEARLQAGLLLALAPAVHAEFVAQLTNVSDAAEWLDELERDGLGSIDRDGYFTYHHAIRVVLARRGLEKFTDAAPGEVGLLLSSTLSEALRADGSAATIAAVVQSVHEPVPSIALLRLVDAALTDLQSRPECTDLESAVYRALEILALLWSAKRYVDGAARAEQFGMLVQQLDSRSSSGVREAANWGLLYSSVTLVLAGDLALAKQMLTALGTDHDSRLARRVRVQRAFTHAMGGEVGHAAQLLNETAKDFTESVPWSARRTLTLAAVRLESGDATEAQALLRGLEAQLDEVQEWPYVLTVLSRSYIALDPVAGLEDLDRLMRLHGGRPISPRLHDVLFAALGDLALAAGEIQRAVRLIGRPARDEPSKRLTAARLALATGDASVIPDLRALAEQHDLWPRKRAQALLLLAVHLHRQGAEAHAARSLKQALVLTAGHRIRLIQSLVPHSELEAIAEQAGLELPANVGGTNPLEPSLTATTLTDRELVLLGRLASTDRLRDIAAQEFVSLHTIKSQVSSIYRKLGVRSRQAAVQEAYLRGIINH